MSRAFLFWGVSDCSVGHSALFKLINVPVKNYFNSVMTALGDCRNVTAIVCLCDRDPGKACASSQEVGSQSAMVGCFHVWFWYFVLIESNSVWALACVETVMVGDGKVRSPLCSRRLFAVCFVSFCFSVISLPLLALCHEVAESAMASRLFSTLGSELPEHVHLQTHYPVDLRRDMFMFMCEQDSVCLTMCMFMHVLWMFTSCTVAVFLHICYCLSP